MWEPPPPDPAFEIVFVSRGMSKGIAQTDGIQVTPKALVQLGKLQIGGQWKNVSSPVADGEAAAFINYAPKLGSYQLNMGVAYKFQTNVKGETDDDSWEFTSTLSRKFGKVGARLSGTYSPDDLGSARRYLYLEGGPSFDLDKTTRISASIGRRSRAGGSAYTSFNAAISKTLFEKLTVDLRYYDTAQSNLGEAYRARVVISAKLTM